MGLLNISTWKRKLGQVLTFADLDQTSDGPASVGYVDAHSSGLTVTTVEVDFGSTPAQNGMVTITASGVTSSSKLLFWQCNQALTGKGDMADENEVDNLVLKATAGENEIRLYWEADDGWVTMPVVQGGFVNGGVLTSRPNTSAFPVREVLTLFKPIKLGLVSGNFKFNYSIL